MHRLDPRLKVAACLLLVILSFAATHWVEILLLAAAVLLAVISASCDARPLWRFFWMLRWLLLFTLLLHMLLSPGRTLWGLSWLSLDGFHVGALVCAQMLLAVTVGALLAISTSIEDLTMSFGWFVQPLAWLGCCTREWQKLLLLTLGFLPLVQEEIGRSNLEEDALLSDNVETDRWSLRTRRLTGFIARLVERGDVVAHRIATSDAGLVLPPVLTPLFPMTLNDRLFMLTLSLLLLFYWLIG